MFVYIRRYTFYAFVLAIIFGFVIFFNGNGCKPLDTNSPEIDNLKEGDTAYFDRVKGLTEDATELEYGDVIMFRTPDKNRNHFVSRLIGKPGDRIKVINGILSRNGSEVTETYTTIKTNFNLPEILVPEKTVYLLADQRSKLPEDSRKFGPIPFTHLVGVVTNSKD